MSNNSANCETSGVEVIASAIFGKGVTTPSQMQITILTSHVLVLSLHMDTIHIETTCVPRRPPPFGNHVPIGFRQIYPGKILWRKEYRHSITVICQKKYRLFSQNASRNLSLAYLHKKHKEQCQGESQRKSYAQQYLRSNHQHQK